FPSRTTPRDAIKTWQHLLAVWLRPPDLLTQPLTSFYAIMAPMIRKSNKSSMPWTPLASNWQRSPPRSIAYESKIFAETRVSPYHRTTRIFSLVKTNWRPSKSNQTLLTASTPTPEGRNPTDVNRVIIFTPPVHTCPTFSPPAFSLTFQQIPRPSHRALRYLKLSTILQTIPFSIFPRPRPSGDADEVEERAPS
ncbi:hypothetical protein BGW42_008685, partial [Actinomortierella wolfii]